MLVKYENSHIIDHIIFRKIGEAEDDGEVDFMIYVNHAQYELRCVQF